MHIKSSAFLFAVFGVGPLLLAAGCGDSSGDGARSTISPIQPSSYVTILPATTTTTTTIFIDPAAPQEGQISPVEQNYEIQAGDSLSKIASQFDITMDVLINYNGWTDGTDHFLLPGEVILIPPNTPVLVTGVDTPTDDPVTAAPDDGLACTHTIAAGENPTRVAAKYGLTFDQLQLANPFIDFYQSFTVGDTINIPEPGTC